MSFKSGLSLLSWIFLLLEVLGNFGVSDADVALPSQQLFLPATTNNKLEEAVNYEKVQVNGRPKVFHRNVASSSSSASAPNFALDNPSQWMSISNIFDELESDWIHPRNISHTSRIPHFPHHDEMSISKLSKVSNKPKFSYHRVQSLQNRGRPIAAVTLTEEGSTAVDLLNNVNPAEHSHLVRADGVFLDHFGVKQGRHHHHQHQPRRNGHHHHHHHHHKNKNHHHNHQHE